MGLPQVIQVVYPLTPAIVAKAHPQLEALLSTERNDFTVVVLDPKIHMPYVDTHGPDTKGTLFVNETGFTVVLDSLKKMMEDYQGGLPIKDAATRFVARLSQDFNQ